MDFLTLKNDIKFSAYEKVGNDFAIDLGDAIKRNEKYHKKRYELFGYPFKHASEMEVFCQFVELLTSQGLSEMEISQFSDYFVFSYEIPQIAKEFDLIRMGDNYNINIELKSNTTIIEQENQLKKNRYYLKFLTVPTYYFSFSPEINSYMEYDSENDKFLPVDFKKFWEVVSNQEVRELSRKAMDNFFAVSNYLVSPFNSTEKFLNSEYFLTGHQEEVVKEVLLGKYRVYAIKGNPGTGKTLLTYHLARQFISQGKKIVILHGGNLNAGHLKLNEYHFNILPIKDFREAICNIGNYEVIILDESQRLRRYQVEELKKVIEENPTKIFLLSMDAKQILGPKEDEKFAKEIFESIKKSRIGKTFSLKDKIRSNKEMSNFIQLLNKIPIDGDKEKIANQNRNIRIKYFSNRKDAYDYIRYIEDRDEWQVLTYTKSNPQYKKDPHLIDKMIDSGLNSHEAIGQEFDKVLIPMDDNFRYSLFEQNGKKFELLNTSKSYYRIDKMFYQNITRTRTHLQLVIIENFPLYKKITDLLDEF